MYVFLDEISMHSLYMYNCDIAQQFLELFPT